MKKLIKYLLPALMVFTSPFIYASDLSPESVSGATTVDAAQAKQLFDDEALFIDTRKDKDWDAGRVPGAEHLDVKKALTADSLAAVAGKDEAIVMYCNGHKCMRSSKGAAMAVEWGYSKVYYFRDGFPAWKDAGYPVE